MQLIRADWPAPPGVIAGTTTRTGGVSARPFASLNLGAHVGDDPAAVSENRRRLAEFLDLPEAPRWLEQVHGSRVVHAGNAEFASGPPEADAAVCLEGRAVLGILTADCLSVLLCDSNSQAIGAIHCGWRGLAAGVIDAAVHAMTVPPARLLAWLGPAIGQDRFEVGDDVRDLFLAGIENAATCFRPNANGRWQADLGGLARLYLARAGVGGVYGGGFCTHRDAGRFFSYRRDGRCGRMASYIFRRLA